MKTEINLAVQEQILPQIYRYWINGHSLEDTKHILGRWAMTMYHHVPGYHGKQESINLFIEEEYRLLNENNKPHETSDRQKADLHS